ncbi:MAG: YtxH domain-containing protein [Bacilli bacterium]|nr:YtxH domain-containing protein [Bacilli bacterium]
MSKKGLGKFVLGAAIGAGIGLLFAPRSGKETRKLLKDKMDDLVKKAKELDKEEVKAAIDAKIKEIKEGIKNLDKETVIATAKKQGKLIRDKAEELVNYVKEKGTPVMEKTAESIRKKAIDVTKDVLKKLESKQAK